MKRESPKYPEMKAIFNKYADQIDRTLEELGLTNCVNGMGIGWDQEAWAPYLDLSIRNNDDNIADKFPKKIGELAVKVTVRNPHN